MPKITIVNGPTRIELENGDAETVGDLLAMVGDQGLLNVPTGATPQVNGAAADRGTRLYEGDEVAFTKPAGEKG